MFKVTQPLKIKPLVSWLRVFPVQPAMPTWDTASSLHTESEVVTYYTSLVPAVSHGLRAASRP